MRDLCDDTCHGIRGVGTHGESRREGRRERLEEAR